MVSRHQFDLGSFQCDVAVPMTALRKPVFAWCTVDAEAVCRKVFFFFIVAVKFHVALQCSARPRHRFGIMFVEPKA